MSDLLWPGDHRAGGLFGDHAVLAAMVAMEQAWLDALVATGVAPPDAAAALPVPDPGDLVAIAEAGEAGGNPVIPLVSLLRERTAGATARWLHRGLTSQDVLDTALVICSRDALAVVRVDLERQVTLLADLAAAHRETPMVARTLTQHAVPTTFGLTVAGWLTGVLDARDDVAGLTFPVQLGGAGGTMAAAAELARPLGPARASLVSELGAQTAAALGLHPALPWHTTRSPVTRFADAAVRCTDAWGRISRDVLLLTRPEFGELTLRVTGGSSTMPHKQNPTVAVLLRRAALAAPALAATLHLAAADAVEQRSDGAWHAEWGTLRLLLRRAVVAAAHGTDLAGGLVVDPARMAATLAASLDGALAEQRSMAGLSAVTGTAETEDPAGYFGTAAAQVDAVLARAAATLP